jgi:hypothetical protein
MTDRERRKWMKELIHDDARFMRLLRGALKGHALPMLLIRNDREARRALGLLELPSERPT